jgi:hypothetical protein
MLWLKNASAKGLRNYVFIAECGLRLAVCGMRVFDIEVFFGDCLYGNSTNECLH